MSVNTSISAAKEKQPGRRQVQKFKENPFVEEVSVDTKTRTKRITSKAGASSMMVVGRETGEILGPAGFWTEQQVDKAQFVKLYVNGVKAFKELTGAGTKVFEVLYFALQKSIGKDRVFLIFGEVNQDITPMVERTFYRGVAELVDKKFLAASMAQGSYFVNPDYVWNGDRLAFVKTFRVQSEAKRAEQDTQTMDLFNQEQDAKVNTLIATDKQRGEE